MGMSYKIIHTGQHYDREMSASFFDDLGLPKPDKYLGIGSGTHAEQTGKIMIEFEKICFKENPDLVMVVGDVNSTIACALVAAKLGIPVAHVEAGLRSFDRTMPEEINRILTDQISDYLFTTCEDANQNLAREGIKKSKIYFVGNVMIDTLFKHIEKAKTSNIKKKFGLETSKEKKRYALMTLHRPSNVDNPMVLRGILQVLSQIIKKVPIIFPVHPRTMKKIQKFELKETIHYVKDLSSMSRFDADKKILAVPPLGYLDFLNLMSDAVFVLTDSGGIQEETTILRIPCLTLRHNTERPITVKQGTNVIVGNDPAKILKSAMGVLERGILERRIPKYWDGKAAQRIVKNLSKKF